MVLVQILNIYKSLETETVVTFVPFLFFVVILQCNKRGQKFCDILCNSGLTADLSAESSLFRIILFVYRSYCENNTSPYRGFIDCAVSVLCVCHSYKSVR